LCINIDQANSSARKSEKRTHAAYGTNFRRRKMGASPTPVKSTGKKQGEGERFANEKMRAKSSKPGAGSGGGPPDSHEAFYRKGGIAWGEGEGNSARTRSRGGSLEGGMGQQSFTARTQGKRAAMAATGALNCRAGLERGTNVPEMAYPFQTAPTGQRKDNQFSHTHRQRKQ